MRLYSFEYENQLRIGAQWRTELVDLVAAYRILFERRRPANAAGLKRLPSDLLKFLQLGVTAFDAAREALTFAARRPAIPSDERTTYSFDEIKLRAPLPRPGKIVCNGPSGSWFAKMPSTVVGTGDLIIQPGTAIELQCRSRLGVVIGRATHAASEAEAMTCIACVTILNDILAQNIDSQDQPDFISRNFDTFCPMGPCLILADDLHELGRRNWRTIRNDEIIQTGSMSEAIGLIPRLLHELSDIMTLEAGDIIGIPLSADSTISLKSGDSITIEIEGIGKLENRSASRDLDCGENPRPPNRILLNSAVRKTCH